MIGVFRAWFYYYITKPALVVSKKWASQIPCWACTHRLTLSIVVLNWMPVIWERDWSLQYVCSSSFGSGNANWEFHGFVFGLFRVVVANRSIGSRGNPEGTDDWPIVRLIVTSAEWRTFGLILFYPTNFQTIQCTIAVTFYCSLSSFHQDDLRFVSPCVKKELHIRGELSKLAQCWNGSWQRLVLYRKSYNWTLIMLWVGALGRIWGWLLLITP